MKLSRTLTIAAIGLTSFAALTAGQGCSSSNGTPATETDSGAPKGDTGTPKTDGGTKPKSDSSTGTPDAKAPPPSDKTDAGRPPPPPPTKMTMSTAKHNMAIRNLYLGDESPGTFATGSTPPAWASFGYNIDGLITTAQSTDVCTFNSNGSTQDQVDGTNGIDNSFGENIDSFLSTLAPSTDISADIAAGKFTLEFNTVGLDGTATQSATGLTGALFAGSTYAGTPATTGTGTSTSFDITDNWPVNGSLLVDPTNIASGSKINFANAYVNGGVWVSGEPNDISLTLSLMGQSLSITIHAGVVTLPITTDAAGQFHSKTGIVSGVIETTEFVTAVNAVLAGIGECGLQSTVEPLLLGAQDIIIGSDGTTITNTKGTPCNGISIGLAFDADEIAQPSTVAPAADAGAAATSCGDAG
jgi:hypothetical protein